MSDVDDAFAWSIHGYLAESIRFADAKAAATFTFSSGLLGALCAVHKGPWNFGQGTGTTAALFWVGATSLVFAIVTSAWCVWPRLGTSAKRGLIYWGHIVAHDSADKYSQAIGQVAPGSQASVAEVSHHAYDLAVICRNKYRWLAMSMTLMLVGGAFGLFSLLLRP